MGNAVSESYASTDWRLKLRLLVELTLLAIAIIVALILIAPNFGHLSNWKRKISFTRPTADKQAIKLGGIPHMDAKANSDT
jgi:hypothetical protein